MTPTKLEDLRNACMAAVEAAAPTYVMTDLFLSSSPFPVRDRIENLTSVPRVSFLGTAFEQFRLTRSVAHVREELTIQVCVQQKIRVLDSNSVENNLDPLHVDKLIRLQRQIADTLRVVDVDGFRWFRTEAVRDAFNLPYGYDVHRDTGVFQGIFNSVYGGMD